MYQVNLKIQSEICCCWNLCWEGEGVMDIYFQTAFPKFFIVRKWNRRGKNGYVANLNSAYTLTHSNQSDHENKKSTTNFPKVA
jgi:hypothetical protein